MANAASKTTAPSVTSKLGDALTTAFTSNITKMVAEKDHATPNLGALVLATRTALGVSQMQLGRNQAKGGGKIVSDAKTPDTLGEKDKGHRKSGWFSHVANIEQGGRKTPIDPAFVAYLAAAAQVPATQVEALVAEDAKLRTASSQANATPANA